MHKPDQHEIAVSTAALTWGFNSVFPIVDYDQGVVELYCYLAEVGAESERIFDELYKPDEGVPGVWAYEVDEECGAWIAEHFKDGRELPEPIAYRAKLLELARHMLDQ